MVYERSNLILELINTSWYKLLDSGNKKKLEKFNKILVSRFDSKANWNIFDKNIWDKSLINFNGITWNLKLKFNRFLIKHLNVKFYINFNKSYNVGIFPEKTICWSWIKKNLKKFKDKKILILFGYSGIIISDLYSCNSDITYVDISNNSVKQAKINFNLNYSQNNNIKFYKIDVFKFLKFACKKKNKYNIIIADPPEFSSLSKKRWKISNNIVDLINMIDHVSNDKCLVFINIYSSFLNNYILHELIKSLIPKILKLESGIILTREKLSNKKLGKRLFNSYFIRWMI